VYIAYFFGATINITMKQSTLLAVLLLGALILFLLVIRGDGFTVNVNGYGDYVASLMNHDEPYGRVYSRSSYATVKGVTEADRMNAIRELREWGDDGNV